MGNGFNNKNVNAQRDVIQSMRDVYVENTTYSDPNVSDQVEKLFARLSQQADLSDEADKRRQVKKILQELKDTTSKIQEDPKSTNLTFFEQRIRNLYNVRKDIARVAIISMASPALGFAEVIRSVAVKLKAEFGIADRENE